MNRRNFIRSGVIFGASLAFAPKLSYIVPEVKEPESQTEIFYGPGCPGFEALLADLVVGFRAVFGEAALLAPDTADYQFLCVIAQQQCGLYCQIETIYKASMPQAVTEAYLDKLIKYMGASETDEEPRKRGTR